MIPATVTEFGYSGDPDTLTRILTQLEGIVRRARNHDHVRFDQIRRAVADVVLPDEVETAMAQVPSFLDEFGPFLGFPPISLPESYRAQLPPLRIGHDRVDVVRGLLLRHVGQMNPLIERLNRLRQVVSIPGYTLTPTATTILTRIETYPEQQRVLIRQLREAPDGETLGALLPQVVGFEIGLRMEYRRILDNPQLSHVLSTNLIDGVWAINPTVIPAAELPARLGGLYGAWTEYVGALEVEARDQLQALLLQYLGLLEAKLGASVASLRANPFDAEVFDILLTQLDPHVYQDPLLELFLLFFRQQEIADVPEVSTVRTRLAGSLGRLASLEEDIRPPVPDGVAFTEPASDEDLGEFLEGLGILRRDEYFAQAAGVRSATYFAYGVGGRVPGEVGYLIGGIHYINESLQIRHEVQGERGDVEQVDPMDVIRLALRERGEAFFASVNPASPHEIIVRYPRYWDEGEPWQYNDVNLGFAINRLLMSRGAFEEDLVREVADNLPEAATGGTVRRHRLGQVVPHRMYDKTRQTFRQAFATQGPAGEERGAVLQFFLEWISAFDSFIPVYDEGGVQLNRANPQGTEWRIRFIPDDAETQYLAIHVGRRIAFDEAPFSYVADRRFSHLFDELGRRLVMARALYQEGGSAVDRSELGGMERRLTQLWERHQRYMTEIDRLAVDPYNVTPGIVRRFTDFYRDLVRLAVQIQERVPVAGNFSLGDQVLVYRVVPPTEDHRQGLRWEGEETLLGRRALVVADPMLAVAVRENWSPLLTRDVLETMIALDVLRERGSIFGSEEEAMDYIHYHYAGRDEGYPAQVFAAYRQAVAESSSPPPLSRLDRSDPYVSAVLESPVRPRRIASVPAEINVEAALERFLRIRHGITDETLIANLQRVVAICLVATPHPFETGIDGTVLTRGLNEVFPKRGERTWEYKKWLEEFFRLMRWSPAEGASLSQGPRAALTAADVANLALPRYLTLCDSLVSDLPTHVRYPFNEGLAREAIGYVLDHHGDSGVNADHVLAPFRAALDRYNISTRRTESLPPQEQASIPTQSRLEQLLQDIPYEGEGELSLSLIQLALHELHGELVEGRTVPLERARTLIARLVEERRQYLGHQLASGAVNAHATYLFRACEVLRQHGLRVREEVRSIPDPELRRVARNYLLALVSGRGFVDINSMIRQTIQGHVRDPELQAVAIHIYRQRLEAWVGEVRDRLGAFSSDVLGVIEFAHDASTSTTQEGVFADIISQGRDLTPDTFTGIETRAALEERLARYNLMVRLIGGEGEAGSIEAAITEFEAEASGRADEARRLADAAAEAERVAAEETWVRTHPPLVALGMEALDFIPDTDVEDFYTTVLPALLSQQSGTSMIYESEGRVYQTPLTQEGLQALGTQMHQGMRVHDLPMEGGGVLRVRKNQIRYVINHVDEPSQRHWRFLERVYEREDMRPEAKAIYTSLFLLDVNREDAQALERIVDRFSRRVQNPQDWTRDTVYEFQREMRLHVVQNNLNLSEQLRRWRQIGDAPSSILSHPELFRALPPSLYHRVLRIHEAVLRARDFSEVYRREVAEALTLLYSLTNPTVSDFQGFGQVMVAHWDEAMERITGAVRAEFPPEEPFVRTLAFPEVIAISETSLHEFQRNIQGAAQGMVAHGNHRVLVSYLDRDMPHFEWVLEDERSRFYGAHRPLFYDPRRNEEWTAFMASLSRLMDVSQFYPGGAIASIVLDPRVTPEPIRQEFIEIIARHLTARNSDDVQTALEEVVLFYEARREVIMGGLASLPPSERPWWTPLAVPGLDVDGLERLPAPSPLAAEFPVLAEITLRDVENYGRDLSHIAQLANTHYSLHFIDGHGIARAAFVPEGQVMRRTNVQGGSGPYNIGIRQGDRQLRFEPFDIGNIDRLMAGRITAAPVRVESLTGETFDLHNFQAIALTNPVEQPQSAQSIIFSYFSRELFDVLPMLVLMDTATQIAKASQMDLSQFRWQKMFASMVQTRMAGARLVSDIRKQIPQIRADIIHIFRQFESDIEQMNFPERFKIAIARSRIAPEHRQWEDVLLHSRTRAMPQEVVTRELTSLEHMSRFAGHRRLQLHNASGGFDRYIFITAEEWLRVGRIKPPQKRKAYDLATRTQYEISARDWMTTTPWTEDEARLSRMTLQMRSHSAFAPASRPFLVLLQDSRHSQPLERLQQPYVGRFTEAVAAGDESAQAQIAGELRDAVMEMFRGAYIRSGDPGPGVPPSSTTPPANHGGNGGGNGQSLAQALLGTPGMDVSALSGMLPGIERGAPVLLVDGVTGQTQMGIRLPIHWAQTPDAFLTNRGVPPYVIQEIQMATGGHLVGNEEWVSPVLRRHGFDAIAEAIDPLSRRGVGEMVGERPLFEEALRRGGR